MRNHVLEVVSAKSIRLLSSLPFAAAGAQAAVRCGLSHRLDREWGVAWHATSFLWSCGCGGRVHPGIQRPGTRGGRGHLHQEPPEASESSTATRMQRAETDCRAMRCTEWRPRRAAWQFGSHGGPPSERGRSRQLTVDLGLATHLPVARSLSAEGKELSIIGTPLRGGLAAVQRAGATASLKDARHRRL